jgi:hypothetical protein
MKGKTEMMKTKRKRNSKLRRFLTERWTRKERSNISLNGKAWMTAGMIN